MGKAGGCGESCWGPAGGRKEIFLRFLVRKGVLVGPGESGVEARRPKPSSCGVVLAHSPGGETGTINYRLQLPCSIITYFNLWGSQLMGFSSPSTGISRPSLPAQSLASLGTASGSTPQLNRYNAALQFIGLSAPSGNDWGDIPRGGVSSPFKS